MRSDDLLTLFRQDVVDDVAPYLWSDAEAYAYINDAYYMFVRLTGGIADATSPITEIAVTTGERDAPIDAAIMRIRKATLRSTNHEVKVINTQDVDTLSREDYGVINTINNVMTEGPVRYMVIGLEDELARWVQVPTEDDFVDLVVERLPCSVIDGPAQSFTGVGEEHHFHLLKWVRHLAYRKQDVDRFDLIKSDQEEAAFRNYCYLAKQEKDRRKHKVRTTGYGGI